MQDEYTMTADEKEARDLKRAMMSDDFPEGPDGDLEARKIFVGELPTLQDFLIVLQKVGRFKVGQRMSH